MTGNTLSVLLNQPITAVSLVFATNTTFQNPGSLQFVSAAGSTTVTGTNQGGSFPGGTLTFSSATPFTSFTLAALAPAGERVPEFAIDNLTVTAQQVVPEPGTLALAGMGLLPLAGAVVRKRRKA